MEIFIRIEEFLSSNKKFTTLFSLFILVQLILINSSSELFRSVFRENQTAITVRYLINGESSLLNYYVPVFGFPWGLPMEFRLYQWLVAIFCFGNENNILFVGQLLSLIFFGVSIVLVRKLIPHESIKKLILIILISPIYFVFSSAFLIESLALFFSISAIYIILRSDFNQENSTGLFFAIFLGTLAALVKITTWISFVIFIDIYFLYRVYAIKKDINNYIYQKWFYLFLNLIPIISIYYWVKFSDIKKSENILSSALTSKNLSSWNFGSIEQKLDYQVWIQILLKESVLSLGVLGPFIFIAIIITLLVKFYKKEFTKELLVIFLLLICFISTPIIFTNLHLRHDYYGFANSIFFITAALFWLVYIKKITNGKIYQIGFSFLVFLILATTLIFTASKLLVVFPENNAIVDLTRDIKYETNNGLITIGYDWSSELPYKLKRKSLMFTSSQYDEQSFQKILESNKNINWDVLLVKGLDSQKTIEEIVNFYKLRDFNKTWLSPNSYMLIKEKNNLNSYYLNLVRNICASDDIKKLANKNNSIINYAYIKKEENYYSGFGFKYQDDLLIISNDKFRIFRFRNFYPLPIFNCMKD